MAHFYGTDFKEPLTLGQVIHGPFEQIGHFYPVAPVAFGTLLKFGSEQKRYVAMTGAETDAAEFAGIAVNEVASSATIYPGTKTRYEINEPANVLLVGTITIDLSEDADAGDVLEGAKVYLDAAGKVTPAATDGASTPVPHLLIPNLKFTGDVTSADGKVLVGVRKLY